MKKEEYEKEILNRLNIIINLLLDMLNEDKNQNYFPKILKFR